MCAGNPAAQSGLDEKTYFLTLQHKNSYKEGKLSTYIKIVWKQLAPLIMQILIIY